VTGRAANVASIPIINQYAFIGYSRGYQDKAQQDAKAGSYRMLERSIGV